MSTHKGQSRHNTDVVLTQIIDYRLLQLSVNWELNNALRGALLSIADTVGGVMNAVFGKLISTRSVDECHTYANKSLHSYTQYCGVRHKPGVLY